MSATAHRSALEPGARLIVKVGSALLTEQRAGLAVDRIADWARQVGALRARGIDVVVVSSGAVAEGCARLGLTERPRRLHRLQAAAAVGQVGLTAAWEQAFAAVGLRVAMVLLTHEDLANRERYLNARSTLETLLTMGVIPIVNENDTVATQEIRLGDNDTLAAMVTNLLHADRLLILTDRSGIHRGDPATEPDAPIFETASLNDPELTAAVGSSRSAFGQGGIHTKLEAARTAARTGAVTIVAGGLEPQVIDGAAAGAAGGTWLAEEGVTMSARKGWLLSRRHPAGTLRVDAGAAKALLENGVSLLPVGLAAVQGEFGRGDLVVIADAAEQPIARGLTNYSSGELSRLVGAPTAEIAQRLGYRNEDEAVHRDNMVLLPR